MVIAQLIKITQLPEALCHDFDDISEYTAFIAPSVDFTTDRYHSMSNLETLSFDRTYSHIPSMRFLLQSFNFSLLSLSSLWSPVHHRDHGVQLQLWLWWGLGGEPRWEVWSVQLPYRPRCKHGKCLAPVHSLPGHRAAEALWTPGWMIIEVMLFYPCDNLCVGKLALQCGGHSI